MGIMKTRASSSACWRRRALPLLAKSRQRQKTAAKKPAVAAKPASDDPDSAVDIIGPPSQGALAAAGWRIIDDLVTGARLGLPSALVPKTAPARMGSRWTSRGGQIDIETFRLHEGALAALFDTEKKFRRRIVEHSTLTPDSFVMSGMQGLKRFIVRVQSSGGELRGVTILFDQAIEGVMAPIAAAMANTYQGFPDPSAAPPPGLRRSVEYGTAIVVSGQGASDHVGANRGRLPGHHNSGFRPCRAHRRGQGQRYRAAARLRRARPFARGARRRQRRGR